MMIRTRLLYLWYLDGPPPGPVWPRTLCTTCRLACSIPTWLDGASVSSSLVILVLLTSLGTFLQVRHLEGPPPGPVGPRTLWDGASVSSPLVILVLLTSLGAIAPKFLLLRHLFYWSMRCIE